MQTRAISTPVQTPSNGRAPTNRRQSCTGSFGLIYAIQSASETQPALHHIKRIFFRLLVEPILPFRSPEVEE